MHSVAADRGLVELRWTEGPHQAWSGLIGKTDILTVKPKKSQVEKWDLFSA